MRLLEPMFHGRAMTMEAHPRRLQDAREWAKDVAADAGLAEPECFQVRLAMSEAVANAIKHGSTEESDCIRIEAFERNGSLVFEILDSGDGIAAPVGRASEEDESGRGLEVLEMIMDDVELVSSHGGSVLRFAKRLHAA
jgi:anti-sigma regulatory factor (Ser/Thr protein kinase)